MQHSFHVVAMVNIEGTVSPPGEGDVTGVAAILRLGVDPLTAILSDTITVSVAVLTGGSQTAIGELSYD